MMLASAAEQRALSDLAVGDRVKVIAGRQFRNFGGGDAGTVKRVDTGIRSCDVEFDGQKMPLPVAMEFLEMESTAAPSASSLRPSNTPGGSLACSSRCSAQNGGAAASTALRNELPPLPGFNKAAALTAEMVQQDVTISRHYLGTSATASALAGRDRTYEEAEALAQAVSASACATATATSAVMEEVAAIRAALLSQRDLLLEEVSVRQTTSMQALRAEVDQFANKLTLDLRADFDRLAQRVEASMQQHVAGLAASSKTSHVETFEVLSRRQQADGEKLVSHRSEISALSAAHEQSKLCMNALDVKVEEVSKALVQVGTKIDKVSQSGLSGWQDAVGRLDRSLSSLHVQVEGLMRRAPQLSTDTLQALQADPRVPALSARLDALATELTAEAGRFESMRSSCLKALTDLEGRSRKLEIAVEQLQGNVRNLSANRPPEAPEPIMRVQQEASLTALPSMPTTAFPSVQGNCIVGSLPAAACGCSLADGVQQLLQPVNVGFSMGAPTGVVEPVIPPLLRADAMYQRWRQTLEQPAAKQQEAAGVCPSRDNGTYVQRYAADYSGQNILERAHLAP
mmetsp:Transcript_39800/g.91792  ORF Transcript_39800/g.91792 Transcript_39800/m.91792 type:complete len:571 (+) Transcript_39800:53-1765(+)